MQANILQYGRFFQNGLIAVSVKYKGGSAPTNGRPKESNYTGITATIILRAIHTWARSVFQISCKEVECSYSPDDEAVRGIYLVIIGRASSFRSHLRDKICGKIVETYGLKTDTSKDATAKANAEWVAWLLQPIGQAQDANCYCYEEFTLNLPRGLAQVRCGLMHWATGQLEQKGPKFCETTYGQVVKEHLGQLEDWVKLHPVITTKIRHSLFKKILCLGGIERKQDKPLGLSDVENALQGLENWVDEDDSN
ncbi:hypothetical protein BC835DRAFT_1417963 [Cytidiella melzeri]|nr:hypothetical protein BC835DRAFT_1417963 [Cytidiella melzeri]